MSLSQKRCEPCNEGGDALNESQALLFLKETPGWELINNATAIQTKKLFKNFSQSLHYVNQIGELAELENHHPDIEFGWGYATITLQTHDVNGLHENDFILAAKINGLD